MASHVLFSQKARCRTKFCLRSVKIKYLDDSPTHEHLLSSRIIKGSHQPSKYRVITSSALDLVFATDRRESLSTIAPAPTLR
jgi:hypothetical protein